MKVPMYDLHVHTHLSVCSSDPWQTVENIVKYAKDSGLHTIGITNHVWDCEIPAGSDFYAQQPFAHIMKVRDEIPEDLLGVRLLIGAEAEFAKGHVMLAKEYRDQLDYLIVPHSHIHMVGVVLPVACNTFELKAKYLVDSFCDLASQDIATVIAHPFSPLGHDIDGTKAILSCISDEEYVRCFTIAKEHNTAIELNGASFQSEWGNDEYMYQHDRVFSIARDCGCTFTVGSDGHSRTQLLRIKTARGMAERLGLTEDRFLKI